MQRHGGPADRVLPGRNGAINRVPPEQHGSGGAGRTVESSGARRAGKGTGRPPGSRRARRLRGELPAAGDRVEARPRRGRCTGRLRLLGPRRASVSTPTRREARSTPSVTGPAPRLCFWRRHRSRRSCPTAIRRPGHVENVGPDRTCGGGRRTHREHLDGESPPVRMGGLRSGGAGASGDAVRGLRRQRRRRHRRDAGLARVPRARQPAHRHLLGPLGAARARFQLGA